MATADQVLAIAREQLGTKESPAGSNRVKYSVWFGMLGPWCMMFVQWCFAQTGMKLPNQTTASCGAMMRAAQAAGRWVTSGYRPGDVVIYNFPGGAAIDHTGIVERVTASGVVAIEGNTSTGNDSNGGEVMRRTRPYKYVVGAVRPDFKASPTPAAQKIEEDDTVTQAQFDSMMDKWLARQARQEPDASSADARKWAESNGVIAGYADGTKRYKAYCTREQMVIFLSRLVERIKG